MAAFQHAPLTSSSASANSVKRQPLLKSPPLSGDDPLEQIRRALQLPVPKAFPKLRDERVEKVLFAKAGISVDVEQDFLSMYHPKRLEFCGD
ncbi:hypothetical protein JCM6882_008490 [Rhodosporidiobolus microsporus]